MPYAQLDANNIAKAVTDQPIGIPCDWSDIGRHWTGSAFENVLAAPSRIIKDWQFRNRFTGPQLIGIMRAAMAGDDTAALVWLQLSTASDGVDLDNPDYAASLAALAAAYPALAIDPAEILA